MRYLLVLAIAGCVSAQTVVFEGSGDIGVTPKAGSLEAGPPIRLTGGGANVWGNADALFFAWKRITGDVTISADVSFVGAGVNAHRKAMLLLRQDLTPGALYADVALHGDGLTSLQYREAVDGSTKELRSTVAAPSRIQIERRGNQIRVGAAKPGAALVWTAPLTLALNGPIYAGIGMCSHDADVLETAVFSNVRFEQPLRYRSLITIYDFSTRATRTIHETDGVTEAPNWSRDGRYLLVNTGGDLYRLPVGGRTLEKIELGEGSYRCNNDHDLSRDGKRLAFSASSPTSRQSQVYVADADGKNVKLLTPAAPSYFHGWSPSGKWLAFVGQRAGKFELFRVPAAGGPEERLTSKGAYDDGPEYSPDGKWIYFNSNRSGGWDLWRIPATGGGPADSLAERITDDESEDWFPHISPNGKHMLFLSFPKGTEGHNGKMPGMALRLLPQPAKKIRTAKPETLITFFGGQGTINVNSWSPDSKQFAFVIYEPVAAR
jgi:Tol biopolymer transport system component